jgi:prepilin-type processing-associated H-X9-DG protein
LYGPNIDLYPLLNWHGRLLPYIEQDSLWELTERTYTQDWYLLGSPPHIGLTTLVMLFVCPPDGARSWPAPPPFVSAASTSYLGVSGTSESEHNGVLFLDSHIRFAEIVDGMSTTLMVGEGPPSLKRFYGRWYGGWVPWGMANAYLGVEETDVHNPSLRCPFGPYHFQSDRLDNPCSVYHFWSLHPGGANFLFADGSVHFLSYPAASVLPALATRSGAEVVSPPE